MAASIATIRARKARTSIARRQIGHVAREGADLTQPHLFASTATYLWSPPVAGRWKFIGWGPGGYGSSSGSGASGGYFEITRQVNPSQTVTIVVGQGNLTDTSVTFPTGQVATATRAATSTAGAATGGDVNLAGSAGSSPGANPGLAGLGTGGGPAVASVASVASGASAPANLPYRGGRGAATAGSAVSGGGVPGAGGGQMPPGAQDPGGDGVVIAVLLGD